MIIFFFCSGILAKCTNQLHNIYTRDLKLFILDEFDILVNCRTNDQTITQILRKINNPKLLFFSSTMDHKTLDFVNNLKLSKISTIDLLNRNEIFKNILHFFVHVNRQSKFDKRISLSKILDKLVGNKKVFIYVDSKFHSTILC